MHIDFRAEIARVKFQKKVNKIPRTKKINKRKSNIPVMLSMKARIIIKGAMKTIRKQVESMMIRLYNQSNTMNAHLLHLTPIFRSQLSPHLIQNELITQL